MRIAQYTAIAILTSVSLGATAPAEAAVITISTSLNQLQSGVDNQGWVSTTTANNNPTNDNYFTGSADSYRSYFFFDLSGVTDTIVSAQLDLRRYLSDAGATIEFFHVSTSPSALVATRGTVVPQPTIHADLGTGTSYGSFTIGAGSTFDLLSFALNAAALADLNAASGYFAIGARVTNGGTMFSSSSSEPGNSNQNFTQQLVLNTVSAPEPASLLLFGTALAGAGVRRWRKRA